MIFYVEKKVYERFNVTVSNSASVSLCDKDQTTNDRLIQENVAMWNMHLSVAYMIPSVISTVVFGAHSDRAGRKPCLLLPCFSGVLYLGITALIVQLDLPLEYLLISHVLGGSLGGYTILFLGSIAYTADTTTDGQRGFRIFVLDGLMLLGGAIGVVSVDYWIAQDKRSDAAFLSKTLAIGALYTMTAIYAVLFVPETVKQDPTAKLFSVKNIAAVVSIYSTENSVSTGGNGGSERTKGSKEWKLRILFASLFFVAVALSPPIISIDILYVLNRPFCWDAKLVGLFLASTMALMTFGGALGLFIMQHWWKMSDIGIALVALISAIAANVLKAFANKPQLMFVSSVLGMLALLIIPMIRAQMSKTVHQKKQGALFASVAAMETLSALLASVTFGTVYSATVDIFSGVVFLTVAALFGMGFLLLCFHVIYSRRRTPSRESLKIRDVSKRSYSSCQSSSAYNSVAEDPVHPGELVESNENESNRIENENESNSSCEAWGPITVGGVA
ncbi:proton-coupled folate transporter-like [Lingula anatina]|uniref:Proton-coupled folate transporter-like n=1 Tax=Lingula anatina TaxID=7574 RepID=A0A1S3JL16_LINAN|nr:proton-coupled folate transporter-like [Lingula anatina]|eukprot:XP_013410831.1 proton-coupled folate transporter-like [Lingula anatina]